MANDITHISFDNFRIIKHVKTDSYGIIYTAYWSSKSRRVALKYISTYRESEIDVEAISKEINDLKKNTHENITQVLGISKDDEKRAIVIVLQNTDSSLSEYLENKTLKWSERLKLAYEITSGLDFIHSFDYVHRNLHSLSVFITRQKAIIMDPRLSLIGNETQSLNTLKRMIPYVAPEELEDLNNIPDFKGDIYSLGVILWTISSGREPFQNENRVTIAQSIINNRRESPVIDTPDNYIKLYSKCWDHDPSVRPETQYVLRKLNVIFRGLYHQDLNLAIMNNEISRYEESSSEERKSLNTYQSVKKLCRKANKMRRKYLLRKG